MIRLNKQPHTRVETLADLVGIANAIEIEAVKRYSWLAAEMRRRDEPETAAAFDALAAEEGRHVTAVENWARGLGETPPTGNFQWRLPEDLATSWDEAAASTLLTPYRAYSIAVDNEERAFAFYAYLAAATQDPRIAKEAEMMAQEELRHAAILRTWRRKAWHHDHKNRSLESNEPATVSSLADLRPVMARHEAQIATCHNALIDQLRNDGDTESADLVAGLARNTSVGGSATTSSDQTAPTDHSNQPLGLLRAAQRPLERYCDMLETALLTLADEEAQQEAEQALEGAVARLARLGRHIEHREGR